MHEKADILFTNIKSPTNNVGIIEPDGILKGSTTKERNIRTTKITGKKDFEYSRISGSFLTPFWLRFAAKNTISISQIPPVTALAITKIVGKSKFIVQIPLNI